VSRRVPGLAGQSPRAEFPDEGTLARTRHFAPTVVCRHAQRAPGTPQSLLVANAAAISCRRGDTGARVRKIQRLLNENLSGDLRVDGRFGPLTDDAARAFQRSAHLPVDGVVGIRTLAALQLPIKSQGQVPKDATALRPSRAARPGVIPAAASSASPTPPTPPTPPVPQPPAPAAVAPPKISRPPALNTDVHSWPLQRVAVEVLRRTGRHLPKELKRQWYALVSRESLAKMAATIAIAAAAHLVGVGEIVDVALIGVGIIIAGRAAFEGGKELGRFLNSLVGAAVPRDLDTAAGHLARAIVLLGITVVMTWLTKRAARKAGLTDDAAPRGSQARGTAGAALDRATADRVLSTPKGARPEPSEYLSKDYIDEHLAQFQGGVSKISAAAPTGTVGPPGGTFVLPESLADELIADAGGDVGKLEQSLGLEPGTLGDSPQRIDVADPDGLRMPSGNELGANNQWQPGGYTSGGLPEATIDPAPAGTYTVTPVFE
jgi:hypothetical protein